MIHAWRLAALLAGTLCLTASAWGQARGAPPCGGTAEQDRITGVSAEGDLSLASGRIARLSGIRLPESGPQREQALAFLRMQGDKAVLVRAPGALDRWGRLSAMVESAAPSGSSSAHLAAELVTNGLALVDAGVAETHCAPDLLRLEADARRQSLGIWAQDRYKPLDAMQRESLRERAGAFALVEGRVRSVGERRERTYLNFGGAWAEDFTIVISRKTWTRMAERGVTAASLKGSRIRARGILEDWQGTALTVRVPEMIERIEDPSGR
ncbi:thermonuclease family protein [Microvirga pudoricolor]|uniref:thermonuclease family protein n=1 Tax=Microvirga pudoricolor TaxID=2778729 RepID=UPI00194F7895|nr:thermonuclease family protein [Microvirga pudoricolor]MBM6593502.1 thermonuclease family protein [Microvirga pudoricolor]